MSKKFMHVSIAILCLALAYHLGARNVGAQTGMTFVSLVAAATAGNGGDAVTALAENGDIWGSNAPGQWTYRGNILTGGPVPAEKASLGQVKTKWR